MLRCVRKRARYNVWRKCGGGEVRSNRNAIRRCWDSSVLHGFWRRLLMGDRYPLLGPALRDCVCTKEPGKSGREREREREE